MYKICLNEKLTSDVYKMILEGDTSKITHSGQFINILVDGHFLRRPISICDYDDKTITIVYKVFGSGTKRLSEYREGDVLDCLVGLGNGFEIEDYKNVVLIGGGVGIPPLYNLAKKLGECTVVLGFRDETFLVDEFKALGCKVIVSVGDSILNSIGEFDYYYACGPEGMLLALVKNLNFPGRLSFEERMGCGFGACMGCSKLTKNGSIRVCKEGPVLESDVIIYED